MLDSALATNLLSPTHTFHEMGALRGLKCEKDRVEIPNFFVNGRMLAKND